MINAILIFFLSLVSLVFVKLLYEQHNDETNTADKHGTQCTRCELTLFVHQPHEQQPGDEANRAPQHQHGNVRLGEPERSNGRVLDGTPEVPHHPLHEAQ